MELGVVKSLRPMGGLYEDRVSEVSCTSHTKYY